MNRKQRRPTAEARRIKDTNSIYVFLAFVASVALLALANVGIA